MRAVLYCRVSTVEQTLNLSLETQEQACRAYCAREDYDVDRVFVDAGESAKTANRPAFQELLTYCRAQKGKVHAVVVYSLTRFSRNNADHHAIATLLRSYGVMLRSVTEPIDESPSGKLMEAILAGVAQFDNDVRGERTLAGIKEAAARGRWVWLAPLGYKNTRERERPKTRPSLEPDPKTAPLIRRAFELLASGALAGAPLLAHLIDLGLRGRHGRPLAGSRFYDLLRNPVYTGRIEIKKWGTSIPGDFEPLVTEDVFWKAQRRLDAQRRSTTVPLHRQHPDFPLRRFVRCATCDHALTGSWSKGRSAKYAHYHCKRGCTRVAKRVLEDAFIQLVDRLTPSPHYLKLMRAVAMDVWRERATEERRHRGAMQATMARLEGQLRDLDQAFIYERRIDLQTYQRERDNLRERIVLLGMDVSETTIAEAELDSLFEFAEHALTHASAIWTSADSTEERVGIQSTLFPEGLQWTPKKRHAGPGLVEPRSFLQFYQLDELVAEKAEWGITRNAGGTAWARLLSGLRRVRETFPAAA